jgi:hypothetical protein
MQFSTRTGHHYSVRAAHDAFGDEMLITSDYD